MATGSASFIVVNINFDTKIRFLPDTAPARTLSLYEMLHLCSNINPYWDRKNVWGGKYMATAFQEHIEHLEQETTYVQNLADLLLKGLRNTGLDLYEMLHLCSNINPYWDRKNVWGGKYLKRL